MLFKISRCVCCTSRKLNANVFRFEKLTYHELVQILGRFTVKRLMQCKTLSQLFRGMTSVVLINKHELIFLIVYGLILLQRLLHGIRKVILRFPNVQQKS